MAGIAKTYLNYEQYKELKSWYTKEVKKQIKKDLGFNFSYYKHKKVDFGKDGLDELPVWNTPSVFDIWLAKNCKLPFIQERLKEQHSDNWIGWLDYDFSEKGFITEYKKNSLRRRNSNLHF